MTTPNPSVSNAELAVEKNNEGVSRFKAGDLAGAARAFNDAVEYDPSLDEARENRDMAIKRLGYDPMVESRDEKSSRSSELEIDASAGDLVDRLIQYGMYALAGVIGIGMAVGIWGILGPGGIIALLVGAGIVWAIKWSWLVFLK